MVQTLVRQKWARPWFVFLIGLSAGAFGGIGLAFSADGTTSQWLTFDATNASDQTSAAQDQGKWSCITQADLPVKDQRVGGCRNQSGGTDAGELKLILFTSAGATKGRQTQRVVSGFADARSLAFRVLVPPGNTAPAQSTGSAAGLLLVDQWDESSCYGTQIYLISPGGGLKSLGFINEVKADADDHPCAGGWMQVTGTNEDVTLKVVGALARIQKDGTTKPLGRQAVEYRVSLTSKPGLKRIGN